MTMTFQDACAAVCAPGTMFEIQETEVLGRTSKVFAGTPPNIRSLFALAAAAYRRVHRVRGRALDHAGPLDWPAQIGHLLVNELGVAKGDRVAIAMRNYPEWIAAFVAITSVGAVVVPMNAWWVTDELVFAIEDSGSKVVIADDERLARMQAADPGAIDATIVVARTERRPARRRPRRSMTRSLDRPVPRCPRSTSTRTTT